MPFVCLFRKNSILGQCGKLRPLNRNVHFVLKGHCTLWTFAQQILSPKYFCCIHLRIVSFCSANSFYEYISFTFTCQRVYSYVLGVMYGKMFPSLCSSYSKEDHEIIERCRRGKSISQTVIGARTTTTMMMMMIMMMVSQLLLLAA